MKMITVTFQIPEPMDEYYAGKAKKLFISKSQLLRGAVMRDYEQQPDKEEFKHPQKQKRAIAA